LLGSTLAATVLVTMLAPAAGASAATVASLDLSGGPGPAVHVPTLDSLHPALLHGSGGAAAYGSRGRGAPPSSSELVVTKKLDVASPILSKAVVDGSHYGKGSVIVRKADSSYEAICMTDAFPVSTEVSGNSVVPEETISIAYSKVEFHYGAGASCDGSSAPPIESTLVGLNRSASRLTARLDCLAPHCSGIFAVSLPRSACSGEASKCSFTGGIRIGLGGGRVHFNHDGTAFTGGVKVGIGGAGSFSMGDGSVRVLQMQVPARVHKWLVSHPHGKIISWIALRGAGKAILDRETIGGPAKLDPGIPTISAAETGPPTNEPPLTPQSLSISQCSQSVVGSTLVSVKGSLSPPRGGATVSLTYTPLNGPAPLPAPIVHSVTTTATGDFGENFDRRQGGKDYSWEVVATIAKGDGYVAASSAPCAVPIP
jgi:type VI secretion system (T6SS) effector Hcp